MKTVQEVMTRDVVWVSPSARVVVAVTLMKKNRIAALPVINTDGRVVGLVTQEALLGESEDTAIGEVMQRDYAWVPADMSVRDASEDMARTGAGHLLVMDDGRLLGIVSRSDLIPELGRNFDPLTGLPWADAFREWAMNALKHGLEISVIFFDIDNFGAFNKKYGHVIGDAVIVQVSEVLKSGVDPQTDFVCRYAGDEFAIVSLRKSDEARALAEELQRKVGRIRIEGLPSNIGATFGIYGGRRTREREDMHYAATIDDLITHASKECTAHKPPKPGQEAAAPEPQPTPAAPAPEPQPRTPQQAPSAPEAPGTPTKFAPPVSHAAAQEPGFARLKIQTVTISTGDTQASASVSLLRSDREYNQEARGYAAGGRNILRLVAEAAAGAATKSMETGHAIVVDEVLYHEVGDEDEVVTVTITFITPRWTARQVGSAVVRRGDQFRATAAAVLAAANRLIESVPEG